MWQYNDGGRGAAGYRGDAGDCVVRAIAIAAQLPYGKVYDDLAELNGQRRNGKRSARDGTNRKVYESYLLELGFTWTPTMSIGSGCTVHLRADELPPGRLVVRASKHVVAVIDGVIHDTYDPSREGTRCVYGYYSAPTPACQDAAE